jgi:methyl-accepting chemotaxis protein
MAPAQNHQIALEPNKTGTWLNIKRSMMIAGTALIVAVGSFIFFMQNVISEHRVGGESYQQIVNDKDLIADLIPPPLLPFEAFSMIHAARDTSKGLQLEKMKTLEQSYRARLEYWTVLHADSKDPKWELFQQELKKRGDEFWTAVN